MVERPQAVVFGDDIKAATNGQYSGLKVDCLLCGIGWKFPKKGGHMAASQKQQA